MIRSILDRSCCFFAVEVMSCLPEWSANSQFSCQYELKTRKIYSAEPSEVNFMWSENSECSKQHGVKELVLWPMSKAIVTSVVVVLPCNLHSSCHEHWAPAFVDARRAELLHVPAYVDLSPSAGFGDTFARTQVRQVACINEPKYLRTRFLKFWNLLNWHTLFFGSFYITTSAIVIWLHLNE